MTSLATPYLFPNSDSQAPAQGKIIWLFGLSGAGKSTIAQAASNILKSYNKDCFILDGDNLRTGLNSDLGFSEADRQENIRRAAETALLLSHTCDVVLCTFITPKQSYRQMLDTIFHSHPYQSVCINTPLSECEKRDTKGLYKKAREGEIKHFTGISSPYDFPQEETICIETIGKCKKECALELIKLLNLKE